MTDEELIARFRSSPDPKEADGWISELFRRHYARVACWCLRVVGDRESAADMAQDVFMKAYRHLDSYKGTSKFSTWLFSVTRNHCLSEMRARATRPEEAGHELLPNLADTDLDPYRRLEHSQAVSLMRELIESSLNETEKKVMTLHYSEELPLDSVTRLLGLENLSGAKAFLVSARRKLARALALRKREHRLAG